MSVAGIDYRSPEHSNRRLEGKQFLQSGDVMFFDELLVAIRGLAPDEDRVERWLPDANEAGAWDKAYSIYTALKRQPARGKMFGRIPIPGSRAKSGVIT